MAKASPLQPSFTAGEVSPLVYGRVDADRYKTGVATCLNYFPTLQGPLIRRPGTKYVTTTRDGYISPATLIPFQFNQVQAYVLEFGNTYIRFFQNGGQITNPGTVNSMYGTRNSGFTNFYALRSTTTQPQFPTESVTAVTSPVAGTPLEIISPYAQADVAQIRWAQNADTLYLTHPSYPPYKLQRTGTYTWELAQVSFQDGPYLPLNSYTSLADHALVSLTPSAVLSGILLTGPTNTITGCANSGSGTIRVTTSAAHGRQSGDKVYITGVAGTTEANNSTAALGTMTWTIIVITTTTFDLVGSAFVHAWTAGGTVYPALFEMNSAPTWTTDIYRPIRLLGSDGKWYYGNITTTNNPASANFVLSSALPGTTAISFWQLGEWTYTARYGANYPACVCFHQNRLAYAGAPNQPQEVNFSFTGQFDNFQPSIPSTAAVADSNAMQFTLSSNDVNAIRWLKSEAQGLLAGTQSSEWIMQASSANQAMTPTNFNASQTSFFGSANIDAVQAGNATLHIQRAQRKLREMNYFFQVGTFRSTDLSELSEHITLPTITKLVVQKETHPIVWALRSDGVLLSMAYNRDDLTIKAGWARHTLGGQSDAGGTAPIVQSIAVIPSADGTFDQLWMTVQRWINGAAVLSVEYMTKPYDDGFEQADSYHFDCGVTYDAYKFLYNAGVQTGSAQTKVNVFGHGFSAGDQVTFSGVKGCNLSTTDVNGNVTTTNLVNGKFFLVAASPAPSANAFYITDLQGVDIDSTLYSPYVGALVTSVDKVRKCITTISGLTWLKNETVSILADGGIHREVVVSNAGVVTLDYKAGRVQIGYKYNSDGQTLRPDAGAADGSSIGKMRRPCRFAMMMRSVGEMSFGTSFTDLIPFKVERADVLSADAATPLFSSIHRDGLVAKYDFEGQMCWRQNSGLPGMIQSITMFLEEFDV